MGELVCQSEHGCNALTALECSLRGVCIDSPEAQRQRAEEVKKEESKNKKVKNKRRIVN